jgi:uncharacterized protein (UPF0216 family)
MRWNEQKSQRFQVLRGALARGALTDAERTELEGLAADLDADEAEALRPALEHMDAEAAAKATEKGDLDAKAVELARIADEEERLLAEARAYVQRLRQTSAALAEDYRRVTGHEPAQTR